MPTQQSWWVKAHPAACTTTPTPNAGFCGCIGLIIDYIGQYVVLRIGYVMSVSEMHYKVGYVYIIDLSEQVPFYSS